jgi:hypothetical protein
MIDSFVLGLSSGSACLFSCGVVLFPYLMSASSGVKRIIEDLSLLLIIRLVVYFAMATIAWHLGQYIFREPIIRNTVPGVLNILFAMMLIWYSVNKNRDRVCPVKLVNTVSNKHMVPVILAIVNSLGFCPALFLILTKSATQSTLCQSYVSFLAFFAGSSLWFLPLPLLGRFKKRVVLETIGIFATGIAGVIFMIKGLTNLIGGIING